VGGGAEGTTVDLRQPERGVVRRHHDVGVPDEADAAAEAVAVHRCHHRHPALVDGRERLEAAPVRAHEDVETLARLHLLDVDAGVESPALGSQDDSPHRGVLAEPSHDRGQLEPSGHGQGVDRRVLHHDLGDPGVAAFGGDRHPAAALGSMSDAPSDGRRNVGRCCRRPQHPIT
jgi:hypothetical protein